MLSRASARSLVALVLTVLVPAGLSLATENPGLGFENLPFDELNRMEVRADEARHAFWSGSYTDSLEIYEEITKIKHPSTPLFLNEMAMAYIALGDMKSAERTLRDVDRMFRMYSAADIENKAISKFGEESEKIYKGDPYERAANALLLAFIFMDRGDYDNALAACKTGLLADSDAHENKYQSDFTMLHLMEAKLYQLRGQPDSAERGFEMAREAYFSSHPLVRDEFSQRREFIGLQGLSRKERKKLKIKESDAEIGGKILGLDASLTALRESIDAGSELGPLLTGEYNTLIIYPRGMGPRKSRTGTDGAMVRFTATETLFQPVTTQLDGVPPGSTPITNIADIDYQATTRGGRRMDGILAGQAAFRSTTVTVGSVITQVGQNAGGVIGLGMALVGAAIQGVAGAISPEADTRVWASLPASFEIYGTTLEPGDHEIVFSQSVYFEKLADHRITVQIEGPNDMAVVFAPPQLSGAFSKFVETEGDSKRRRKQRASSKTANIATTFLVPPPLGFQMIERFPAVKDGGKAKAFAVDDRKLTRAIQKALSAIHVGGRTVSHREIVAGVADLASGYPVAFQGALAGLDLETTGKKGTDEAYSATFEFSLVDTITGSVMVSDTITGRYVKARKDDASTTQVFYKCFDDALGRFLIAPEFSEVVRNVSQNATLGSL